MNTRRKLLVVLSAGALAAPFGSLAQPSGKTYRIGYLGAGWQTTFAKQIGVLRDELRRHAREHIGVPVAAILEQSPETLLDRVALRAR